MSRDLDLFELTEILFALQVCKARFTKDREQPQTRVISLPEPFPNLIRHEFAQFEAMQLLSEPADIQTHKLAVKESILQIMDRLIAIIPFPWDAQLHSAIREPMVEFMIEDSALIQTASASERLWAQVHAICDLADCYAMSPADFLDKFCSALDLVERMTGTPEQYREHYVELLDDKHPNIRGPRFEALTQAVRRNLAVHEEFHIEDIHFSGSLCNPENYWIWRARRLQQIEKDIQRIWPLHMPLN